MSDLVYVYVIINNWLNISSSSRLFDMEVVLSYVCNTNEFLYS